MKKAVIIGAGFGGCTPALLLKEKGWDVTVIDKAPFIGGGCRTFFYGGHPYTFGPRHFITPFKEAYDFLSSYLPLRDIKKINYTYVEPDSTFYTYPIHEDDIPSMPDAEQIQKELKERPEECSPKNFEELWMHRVGLTLYNKFVKNYNTKAWQIKDNKEMDWGFEATVKIRALEKGDRYEFREWYNSYPIPHDGYNKFFDIALEGCNVLLGKKITNVDLETTTVHLETGEKFSGDILISTLSPDFLMNNQYGELRYVGREFHKFVLPVEEIFPKDVYFIYYPNSKDTHTRIVEYKKLTQHKSPHTFLGMEVPSLKNKLYPMMIKSEVEKAQKYLDALPDNIYSFGRMGKYRYIDVDDILMDSLKFIKEV